MFPRKKDVQGGKESDIVYKEGNIAGYRREGAKERFEETDKESEEQTEEALQRGWEMTDTTDTFRQGATALNKARGWAQVKREEFVAAANSKAPDTDCLALEHFIE